MRLAKLFLFLSIMSLILLFLFMPHTIELTGTLETWFPYKGLTLYKDISMFHFPLGRFILFPLHLWSNWNLELDPFLGLFIGITNLVLIYYFTRKYHSYKAACIALVFFGLFYYFFATAILYYHELLVGLLLTIALILFFYILDKSSKFGYFFLGFTLSLAEFSGQLATITVSTFIILTFYVTIKKARSLNTLVLFGIGLVIPFFILALYFYSKGAFYHFIYWNTIYYSTYSSFRSQLIDLSWKEIFLFYSPILVSVLLLLNIKKRLDFQFLVYNLLALSTIPANIFGIFHFHHFSYSLPILAIFMGYIFDQLKKIHPKLEFFLLFSFIIASFLLILPWYTSRLQKNISFKITNDIYKEDPMYDAVIWVRKNTKSNDRLMVIGDPLFYMRADRLPSARPAKSIPYSWEPLDQISAEIRATPADYWIVDTNSIKRLIEVNKKQKMADFILEELNSKYSRKAIFDNWEIWKIE